jgi:hypothetical protein
MRARVSPGGPLHRAYCWQKMNQGALSHDV